MNDANDIVSAKERIKSAWLGRAGVTGIDIGVKYKGGKPTGEIAIRLLVRKKLPGLSPDDAFPASVGVHPTDVIEREYKLMGGPHIPNPPLPPPNSARQGITDNAVYNPMLGGARLYIPGAFTTAGMFVTDNTTGNLMLLGTFHMGGNVGDAVNQPDTASTTPELSSLIGYISRRAAPLNPSMDADLFLYTAPRVAEFAIQDLGSVTGVHTLTAADIGKLQVKKRGVRTLVTEGTFEGAFNSSLITLDDGKVYQFDNLISFNMVANGGDSGSVAVDDSGKAVALLTLSGDEIAVGFPITDLMKALNFTPCIAGQVIPKAVTLSPYETQLPPPVIGNFYTGYKTDPQWTAAQTGTVNLKAFPTCPVKTYEYTIASAYQQLSFRATAQGFINPIFSWSLNGTELNTFDSQRSDVITIQASVWQDQSDGTSSPQQLQSIEISYEANLTPSYDADGVYAELTILPEKPFGHATMTVTVEVREAGPASSTYSKSGFASLDTQKLSYGSKYYLDRTNCAAAAGARHGLRPVPFTMMDLLVAQSNPPPDAMKGIWFLKQMRAELGQLYAQDPKNAEALAKVFAEAIGVPQPMLLSGITAK